MTAYKTVIKNGKVLVIRGKIILNKYIIIPPSVLGVGFVSLGSGYFSLKIDSTGKAWSWGYKQSGQLGNNETNLALIPDDVYENHTFCQIVGATYFSLSIDNTGKAWGWGNNYFGNLGNNTKGTGYCKSTPVAVCGNHTFCQISNGDFHSIGLDNRGKLWSWGINNYGQLGDNTQTYRSTPVVVCVI